MVSKNLWSPLMELLSDAVFLLDLEYRIVRCNATTKALFGKPDDMMLGEKCCRVIHGTDAPHPNCPIARLMVSRKRETAEMLIGNRWYEITADPILDSTGNVAFILHSARDIHDRKIQALQLADSFTRLRNMFDVAPYGAHLYDLRDDGRLVFVGYNASADKILDISHQNLIDSTIEEAFPNLANTKIPSIYRDVAQAGTPYNEEQVVYSDNRGIDGAFEIFAFQTAPQSMAVLFRDITERKRNEEAIRISQEELAKERERLAVTLRSIGDGVITTDPKGKVVFLNSVAESMTGWSNADAFGRPLTEVFHIVNQFTRKPCENPVEKVLKTGLIVELANHTMLISRDGREMILADSGSPIISEKGAVLGVVLVFRDVTEKQKMLDTLQQTQKLDSLGILAGGIAHDFNNLLGGIFGYIDLALSRRRSLDNETCRYLDNAMNALNRARNLTQQLLTFAKGGSPIRKAGSLEKTVKECALFALSGSNVTCRFESLDELWGCEYDDGQICQVIDNVVLNAQQAMPSGGAIDVSVKNVEIAENAHRMLKPGKYVRISVQDYGVGIPREIISSIFDPFFTTKQKGHGLGLATSYSIARKHDGTIDVTSEPGKGTCFHILLPVSQQTAGISGTVAVLADYSGNGRILIMDDEDFILDTVSAMLSRMGYETVSVRNGTEALQKLEHDRSAGLEFVAIILDLTIPGGLGGREVVTEIREKDKDIPIIVASGYSDDPVMAKPTEFGFSDSISKPFTLKELGSHLQKLLGGAEKTKERE